MNISKSHMRSTLKQEIKALNKIIDHKILKGIPYTNEAHKHKMLLARLAVLTESNIIARSMRLVSMMMF